jgi:cbb3-type cytochrome oxidase subunit 3
MNPVREAATQAATLGWLLGLTTASFIAVFVGWTLWAWLPSNRHRMDAAARIPFEGDDHE